MAWQICQLPYHPVDFASTQFWLELIQLNKENKLDKNFFSTILFTEQRPMFELFDHAKDPGEFVNLSEKEEYRDIKYQLKAALHCWMIIYFDVVPLPIPSSKQK